MPYWLIFAKYGPFTIERVSPTICARLGVRGHGEAPFCGGDAPSHVPVGPQKMSTISGLCGVPFDLETKGRLLPLHWQPLTPKQDA